MINPTITGEISVARCEFGFENSTTDRGRVWLADERNSDHDWVKGIGE
jgi:hypothetical protein